MSSEIPKTIKTDKHTLDSGWIDVGHGHKVWFEQWGKKTAKIPILLFHGGPGSQFQPKHKYHFDPTVHQVIGFDQRGCGNSLPYGKTQHNTTDDLIADAVNILQKLGIKKVHVSGGSWGSTLALLFAIKHPALTVSVNVRGVFTGTQAEIDWLDKGLFLRHYPEVWERFIASAPKAFAHDPAEYHYKVLSSNDKSLWALSAKALEELETPLLGFDWDGYQDITLDEDLLRTNLDSEYDSAPYRLYAWYLSHQCFMPENYIIKNAKKIVAPLYITQGRYDMACPPLTAYKLHKAVPGSKLFMTLASHGNDPETRSVGKALIATLY